MNIFRIFEKSRKQLIESLEFSEFLFEVHVYLRLKYLGTKNPLIKSSFRILDWVYSWQWNQVKDYAQLLTDFPFWRSRQYYQERVRKFLAYELSTIDFVAEVLYPILSDTDEAHDLRKDFARQATMELDPKSFGFSKSLLGLTPVLEGFDEDPEESFFTEKEFREIIENVLIKIENYPIEES